MTTKRTNYRKILLNFLVWEGYRKAICFADEEWKGKNFQSVYMGFKNEIAKDPILFSEIKVLRMYPDLELYKERLPK